MTACTVLCGMRKRDPGNEVVEWAALSLFKRFCKINCWFARDVIKF